MWADDRRGAPRPAAQGVLPARRQALRRRARRPGAPGRGRPDRSWCGPTRGSSPGRSSTPCARLQVAWSITVSINAQVRACIEAIDESAWISIAYPDGGEAQVAETTYVTGVARRRSATVRLVVRRTRLTDRAQQALWPDWRHHAFVTDLELPVVEMDQFHRDHADRRARHPRPQGGGGPRALPVGKVLRQRGLAWLRRARPQPHPLDRSTRRHPARRSAHRDAHRAHPCLRSPRPAREPKRRHRSCACPSAGPGRPRSSMPSIVSARCRSSPDSALGGPAQPQTQISR